MQLLRELHKALADNAPATAATIGQRILDRRVDYPPSVIEYVNTLLSQTSSRVSPIAVPPKIVTSKYGLTQQPSDNIPEPPDVQAAPVAIGEANAPIPQFFMVDLAIRLDSIVLVAGWTTATAEFGLVTDDAVLDVRHVSVPRSDVAKHFALDAGDKLGMVLVAECPEDHPICLSWEAGAQRGISRILEFGTSADTTQIGARERNILGPALGMLALALPPFSDQWRSFIRHIAPSSGPCSSARGHLEGAAAVERTKDAVVYGWAVHTPTGFVWLEDDSGHIYSLEEAYRFFRQDVHDSVAMNFSHGTGEAGFVVCLHGLKPGASICLKTICETGVHVLSEARTITLPIDPVGAARHLFGVGVPITDMHRRVPLVDQAILTPLIEHRQEVVADLPVTGRQLGDAVPDPMVSIVVPLYGRTDFVEHQLIEFVEDPWLSVHAELIYVLDDPSLVEGFIADAEALHKLYRLPFRWLWGSVNRGFSGANNLGASKARGDYLVFLNSDVFPQTSGWLEPLVEVLATRDEIGAVGPRLVFADGSIQHAGMEFVRCDDLGIWANHHPLQGLDPALDRHRELSIVPAVTGGCLAIRRADFERIGRWDTGYLVGDFEDSDLCLKLRAVGLKSAYLPTVQLTHLERQSFKLLGRDQFSSRLVIYNAVRHQQRWAALIQSVMQEQSCAS